MTVSSSCAFVVIAAVVAATMLAPGVIIIMATVGSWARAAVEGLAMTQRRAMVHYLWHGSVTKAGT
ncbi:MAG: hypothetical protein ACLP0B_13365 [Steroidobacteraceae bacterium]